MKEIGKRNNKLAHGRSNYENFCPKATLYLYFSFCIYCKNPMHIMHYFYHEKTSKKSPKSFLMDEKDAPSCPRVAFTPLKLLRNPLKVTPGHPKSYSRTGSKFAISSGFYSIFTPSKIHILTLLISTARITMR